MVKTAPTMLLRGNTGRKRSSGGLSVVMANISLGPKNSQVNARDVELRSIHAIFPMSPPTRGTSLIASVNTAGSPDNFASFTFLNYGTGEIATRILAGSVTVKMLAVGE